MNTSLSGGHAAHSASVWLPGQGRYLTSLRLQTLRDYLHALFTADQAAVITLEHGKEVLRELWRGLNPARVPQRSHAYRHLFALRLLGLVSPAGSKPGYALAARGASLLAVAEPGSPLSTTELSMFSEAMFSPPPDIDSPLLAFLHLLAPNGVSPVGFVAYGNPVRLRRPHAKLLEVVTPGETVAITGAEAIDHILYGVEPILEEAQLVSSMEDPAPHEPAARMVFPVRPVRPEDENRLVEYVASRLRALLTNNVRVSMPAVSAELRPALRLTHPDFERIMSRLGERHGDEFYFDRLSRGLARHDESAYVFIRGYWRASVVRS